MAQHADMIFCLVRTSQEDIRQKGISFLLIDMHSEGIEVQPINTLDNTPIGHHEVNTVFFEDVKVPKENLIGSRLYKLMIPPSYIRKSPNINLMCPS